MLQFGVVFTIAPAQWPLHTARIDQFLQGLPSQQAEFFDLADDLGRLLEAADERYSTLIIEILRLIVILIYYLFPTIAEECNKPSAY